MYFYKVVSGITTSCAYCIGHLHTCAMNLYFGWLAQYSSNSSDVLNNSIPLPLAWSCGLAIHKLFLPSIRCLLGRLDSYTTWVHQYKKYRIRCQWKILWKACCDPLRTSSFLLHLSSLKYFSGSIQIVLQHYRSQRIICYNVVIDSPIQSSTYHSFLDKTCDILHCLDCDALLVWLQCPVH
jgi:hypothetical protein